MSKQQIIGYKLVPIFDTPSQCFVASGFTNCTYCGAVISSHIVTADICTACVENFTQMNTLDEITKTLMVEQLLNLGFEWCSASSLAHSENQSIKVEFYRHYVYLKQKRAMIFYFSSPTWQNDLLSALAMSIS